MKIEIYENIRSLIYYLKIKNRDNSFEVLRRSEDSVTWRILSSFFSMLFEKKKIKFWLILNYTESNHARSEDDL